MDADAQMTLPIEIHGDSSFGMPIDQSSHFGHSRRLRCVSLIGSTHIFYTNTGENPSAARVTHVWHQFSEVISDSLHHEKARVEAQVFQIYIFANNEFRFSP